MRNNFEGLSFLFSYAKGGGGKGKEVPGLLLLEGCLTDFKSRVHISCPCWFVPAFPSTQDVEAGRSRVQGHSQLPGEFEASLSYIRLCLKIKAKVRGEEEEEEERMVAKLWLGS